MNGVQLGPIEGAELKALQITPDTPVWREGMGEWMKGGQVEELAGLFSQAAPATPPPSGAYCAPGQPQYAPGQACNTPGGMMPPQPPTYLVWSILTTVCCCVVFGIIAIVYSAQVSAAYNRGDYVQAERSSKTALNWIIASAVTGVVMMGLSLLLWFPMVVASAL